MAREKVTNLNITTTFETKGVEEGTRRVAREFDKIERSAKKAQTGIDLFADKMTGRFIALGAVIAQTDRALNVLFQNMQKGDSGKGNWWDDPNAGGGGGWGQFGIDSLRAAMSIAAGLALHRYGGKAIKGGWSKGSAMMTRWRNRPTNTVIKIPPPPKTKLTPPEQPTHMPGYPYEVEGITPRTGTLWQHAPTIDPSRVVKPKPQQMGIAQDTLGWLALTAIPQHLWATATTYGGSSMGAIGAAGAGAVGSSALLAAVVGGISFSIGKAISDAFGGKQYRMSEAFETIGGWVGIGRSNASLKREAKQFYANAPALKERIEAARAGRMAVQQPVLGMVESLMSPAVAMHEQRRLLTSAVRRRMLTWDQAELIESRLRTSGGRFGSGYEMPTRSRNTATGLTTTDAILIEIRDALKLGVPARIN